MATVIGHDMRVSKEFLDELRQEVRAVFNPMLERAEQRVALVQDELERREVTQGMFATVVIEVVVLLASRRRARKDVAVPSSAGQPSPYSGPPVPPSWMERLVLGDPSAAERVSPEGSVRPVPVSVGNEDTGAEPPRIYRADDEWY